MMYTKKLRKDFWEGVYAELPIDPDETYTYSSSSKIVYHVIVKRNEEIKRWH